MELVIVIAVIAVLSAVLIPTFSNIVQRANESNDTQLVRNLNTALMADVGNEHKTMQDAIDAVADSGYDLAKINANAEGNEILWDSANDVFCYSNEGEISYIPETTLTVETPADYEYWQISDVVSDKYSTYLYGYTGSGVINTSNGLDVGSEANIVEINYTGSSYAKDIVIRTNSNNTNLNINAYMNGEDGDTISHYGIGNELIITQVADSAYHEYGYFYEAEIISGRLIVEDGGSFAAVIVEDSNVSNAKLDVVSGGKVGVLYAGSTLQTSGEVPVANEIINDSNASEKGYVLVKTQDELTNALSDENTNKIALGSDITLTVLDLAQDKSNDFTISRDIEINLNLFDITAEHNCPINVTKNNAVILVDKNAKLTLSGYGIIQLKHTTNNMGWNAFSAVINNNAGTVIINDSVILRHSGGTDMAYVVDNNSTVGSATLTVNGGVLESPYRAIRQFANSSTSENIVTVNGGTVRSYGSSAIWLQKLFEGSKATLIINDGIIESSGYSSSTGESMPPYLDDDTAVNFNVKVNGGRFISNGKDVTSAYLS